jgi:trans-aconitate 2-methyltransferase
MSNKDLWNGKQYKENSSPQELSAVKIVKSIEFKGNESVLDIGCGDGKITKQLGLLLSQGKIIGIDPSESMINEANKYVSDCSNMLFSIGNAENFNLKETFDYIFSFHTLHWIKNKIKVFKNIYTHLKPNGKFVFITSCRENQNIANVFNSEKWQKLIKKHGSKFHSSDENKIKDLLQEANLDSLEIKAEYWSRFYSNKNELINWLITWVPFATGLDKNNVLLFSDEIAENMLNESIKNGITDKIEFKTEILTVTALKK